MRELIIERDKWARGGLNGDAELLNLDGAMCCLGFYALACGYHNDDIRHIGEPAGIYHTYTAMPGVHEYDDIDEVFVQTEIADALINANDNEDLSELKREERIKELFGRIDVDVRFV